MNTLIMGSYTDVKNLIISNIKANGQREITGPILQDVLLNMLENSSRVEEITYSDLKALRDEKKLTPSRLYRITDYVTTTVQANTKSAGHPFDVIVLALTESELSEKAWTIQSERDTDGYFANSELSAWQIWYCLDNDANRFDWADATNGKGVIYRMIDEFGNDCPYDFKNIQFYRGWDADKSLWSTISTDGKGVPCYTFSSTGSSSTTEFTDTSLSLSNNVCSNTIKEYVVNNNKQNLNNNCFFGNYCRRNSFGIGCYKNTLGSGCNSILLGKDCYLNSFGNDCDYNSFGNNCHSNSFWYGCTRTFLGDGCSKNSFKSGCNNNYLGRYCLNNSFGSDCIANSFGNNCIANSFGNHCSSNFFGNSCSSNSFVNGSYNSFGNSCSSNSFGNSCSSNSFGNYCSSNSFGNNCYANSFGNYCSNIKFASDSSASTKYHFYKNNHFGDGCAYILFKGTDTASSSAQVQNYNFSQGLQGTSRAYLTIEGKRNRACETYISKDTDGTIKESVIAEKLDKIVEIAYADLVALRDASKLIPGQQYRITDYECTTMQDGTRSAGHQFDIIVTADDANILNEVARAIKHEGDAYFANNDLNAWQIWYSLDNDTTRFAWAMMKGKYIGVAVDEVTIYARYAETKVINDVTYDLWSTGEPYMYIGTKTLEVGEYCDLISVEDGNFVVSGENFARISDIKEVKDGKGVIYRMIDEFGNDCPYDFKNIQFYRQWDENKQLWSTISYGAGVPCYTFSSEGDSSATQFTDMSLLADSQVYSNTIKAYSPGVQMLNHNCFFGDGCNCNTFGNDCYENTFGNSCGNNAFGNGCNSNIFGHSVRNSTFGNNCYGNIFESNCYNNIFEHECYDNAFGNSCSYNAFGNSCWNNAFGNNCQNNAFGNNCDRNAFGNSCNNNAFGESCVRNAFGNGCNNNAFGNNCYNNRFGNDCSNNSLGSQCDDNVFDNMCYENSFGNGCDNNVLGNSCARNSFGNSCTGIKFASDSSASTKYNYYQGNHFGDCCWHIIFTGTSTASYDNLVQNYNFAQGLRGSSNAYLTIAGVRGRDYETYISKDTDGTIKESVIAEFENRLGNCVDLTTEQTINAAKTFSAGIDLNGTRISKVGSPINTDDVANKQYVDDFAATKQGILTAGKGIVIDDSNTISINFDPDIFKVVSVIPEVPAEGDEKKIHLVPSDGGESGNTYDEYIWVNNSWERIGSFRPSVDLSRYAEKSYVDSQIEGEATARTNADTELQTQINGKQEALTLTVKDNGNIILANIQGQSKEFMPATPSGDPMHYAYVAAGAEYNNTGADIVKNAPWADLADDDADKTVVHKAGYWYLNGLGDITNNEMRVILLETNNFLSTVAFSAEGIYAEMLSRVNLPMKLYRITVSRLRISYVDAFRRANNLEALVIPEYPNSINPSTTYCFRPTNIKAMFNGNSSLKFIVGLINLVDCQYTDGLFAGCLVLKTVKLYGIKSNINISSTPKLTLKSILYMINKEKATSPITITLHTDVYNKCMANADILAALEQHTNVSLASA